jgi:hypothetical protein
MTSVRRGKTDIAARVGNQPMPACSAMKSTLAAAELGAVERELKAGDRQHARRRRDDLIATSGEQRKAGWHRAVRRRINAGRSYVTAIDHDEPPVDSTAKAILRCRHLPPIPTRFDRKLGDIDDLAGAVMIKLRTIRHAGNARDLDGLLRQAAQCAIGDRSPPAGDGTHQGGGPAYWLDGSEFFSPRSPRWHPFFRRCSFLGKPPMGPAFL